MLQKEIVRIRYAKGFELGSQIAIRPIVKDRRQIVDDLTAREEQTLHPRAPAVVDAGRATHCAADAAQYIVAVTP
jgi:hypothetical protein